MKWAVKTAESQVRPRLQSNFQLYLSAAAHCGRDTGLGLFAGASLLSGECIPLDPVTMTVYLLSSVILWDTTLLEVTTLYLYTQAVYQVLLLERYSRYCSPVTIQTLFLN